MTPTNTTPLKYTIDTPENRQFLSEIRNTLFPLADSFPHRAVVPITSAMMARR